MRWLLLVVPGTLYVLAIRHTRRARRHLSEFGRSHYLRMYWLGPHAGQRYFTETGWAEQRRAFQFTLAAWLSAIVWMLTFAP